MSNPIHFHILTATHNRPELLKRCYQSLLHQHYARWSWWVGDDASEKTDPALQALMAKDERIQQLRFDNNQGCNRTRNALLNRIMDSDTPGFVMILDDDEHLKPQALEQLSKIASGKQPPTWLLSYCVLPNGKRLGHLPKALSQQGAQINYLHDYMLKRSMRGDFTHCLHTSVIANARFTERFKNAEEWYFFVDIAKRADITLCKVDTKVHEYLPEGLTRGGFNRDQQLKVLQLKVERLSSILNPQQLAPYQLRLARLQLQQQHIADARTTLETTQVDSIKHRLKKYWLMQKLGV